MRVSGIQFNVDTHCLSLYRLKSEHSVHSGHVEPERGREIERERGHVFSFSKGTAFPKVPGARLQHLVSRRPLGVS